MVNILPCEVRRGGGEGEITNQTKNEHRRGQLVECFFALFDSLNII